MKAQLYGNNMLYGRGPARALFGMFIFVENGDQYVPGQGFVDSLGNKFRLTKVIPGFNVQSYA